MVRAQGGMPVRARRPPRQEPAARRGFNDDRARRAGDAAELRRRGRAGRHHQRRPPRDRAEQLRCRDPRREPLHRDELPHRRGSAGPRDSLRLRHRLRRAGRGARAVQERARHLEALRRGRAAARRWRRRVLRRFTPLRDDETICRRLSRPRRGCRSPIATPMSRQGLAAADAPRQPGTAAPPGMPMVEVEAKKVGKPHFASPRSPTGRR